MAKSFIIIGVVFILVGFLLLVLGKIPGLGRLPGDIVIKKENFTFYFPVMTCIVVSVVLSIAFFLINR